MTRRRVAVPLSEGVRVLAALPGAVLLIALACNRAVLGGGELQTTPSPAPTGYLEGRVSIGPLEPVERVGAPRPSPPPAACTARGLVLLTPDSRTEVMRVSFQPDCTYQVAVPAGTYQVQLQARGIDRSPDLPKIVTITSGRATRLDLSIDTGIR